MKKYCKRIVIAAYLFSCPVKTATMRMHPDKKGTSQIENRDPTILAEEQKKDL